MLTLLFMYLCIGLGYGWGVGRASKVLDPEFDRKMIVPGMVMAMVLWPVVLLSDSDDDNKEAMA